MDGQFRNIASEGLWRNNPALVQLLGLCPLLAVSNTAVNSLGLGLATIMVLVCSNVTVSLFRKRILDAVRLPVFVLIIASFVTCAELLMQAYAYPLYLSLGIFIPLIVTNCTILGRAVNFASRSTPLPALVDGLMMGLGFASVLLVLGSLREIIGTGRLFANMEVLLPFAGGWEISLGETYPGFLLALLPPGAFIFMGLLLAGRNIINTWLRESRPRKQGAALRQAGADQT